MFVHYNEQFLPNDFHGNVGPPCRTKLLFSSAWIACCMEASCCFVYLFAVQHTLNNVQLLVVIVLDKRVCLRFSPKGLRWV